MTEILAVFRSRSQAIDCNKKLWALHIPTAIVPTPKEANIGCGLSLKFNPSLLPRVKAYLLRANYSAFWGYLKTGDKFGGGYYG